MKHAIEKYIPELLSQYDCVIIPGFGGFIGNYSPAVINPVHHTFYPPYKSLLFNIHLKQNDGLLAARIAHGEKILYEEALERISMMVVDWYDLLEKGEDLLIDKVGRIVRETDGILQFEQDHSVNYLPEAFGLSSFVSPAIRRPGMQDKIEKKINRYINAPDGRQRKLSRSLKWAAIMALPVGIAVYLSVTNMDQIRDLSESYSTFLFPKSAPVTKKAESAKKTYVIRHTAKAVKPVAKITNPVPQTKTEPSPVATTMKETPEPAANKPFAIIVGAFRFKENAVNLVEKLKQEGYEAGIFDVTKTGLFRVTVGTFESKEEALGQLTAVRNQNYSAAWLLSK
ncbi:MAG: SPOR domain-containing protein [Bacteroidetes bacterium]|nr:SPOR domain-containing protein [Bacteroidota bacterium]